MVGGGIKKVGDTSSILDPDGVVDLVKVRVHPQRQTAFGTNVESEVASTPVEKLVVSGVTRETWLYVRLH